MSQLEVGPGLRPQNSIPNMRREKRRNQVATSTLPVRQGEYAKNKSTGETRFDKYTGEPTTSDRGGRLGVKPGQFEPPALRSVNKQAPNAASKSPASKPQSSFGDKLRNLAKPSTVPIAERPEWKGQSGRDAIVSPVKDQPDRAPLNIPRKSSRRVASPPPSASASTIRSIPPDSGEKSPQLLTSPTAYNPEATSTSRAYPDSSRNNSNRPPVGRTQTRGNALPTEVPDSLNNDIQTSADAIERSFRDALKDVSTPSSDSHEPYEQPPSRFSVTTYAPSTAQNTPRPSHEASDQNVPPLPALPLPTPPKNYETSPPRQQPSSVLNRKRPKVIPEPIPRKMVGSSPRDHFNPNSPIFISMREGRRSSTISGTGKSLPMSPAEAQSQDLITSLQAQLDNLAHLRNNIAKSIRQMTELMPTDYVVLTEEVRKKREIEKARVESLRGEEADIRRLEHDLGLRLHRAYKRQNKDAVYEPTAFWVRRATG